MSFLNFTKPDPRALDIAARRSTPNGLDDPATQGLGEVNQILERHFAHHQPNTDHLDFARIRHLVAAAPPVVVEPWYLWPLKPGHLAGLTAAAALLYVGFAVIPVSTQSEPALEAKVYQEVPNAPDALVVPVRINPEARPESSARTPNKSAGAPEASGGVNQSTKTIRMTEHLGVTEPTSRHHQIKIVTMVPNEQSSREVYEEIRRLNSESEGPEFRAQISETERQTRVTLLEVIMHQLQSSHANTLTVEQEVGPDGVLHVKVNGGQAVDVLDPQAVGDILTQIEQLAAQAALEAAAEATADAEAGGEDTEASAEATAGSN